MRGGLTLLLTRVRTESWCNFVVCYLCGEATKVFEYREKQMFVEVLVFLDSIQLYSTTNLSCSKRYKQTPGQIWQLRPIMSTQNHNFRSELILGQILPPMLPQIHRAFALFFDLGIGNLSAGDVVKVYNVRVRIMHSRLIAFDCGT